MFKHKMGELKDRESTVSQKNAIPSICYQTWESRFLTRKHLSEVEKFRDLNPDLSWKLFDANQRASYMLEYYGEHPIFNIYTSATFGATKADIFRYCILLERGGYYFDISKSCKIQLTKLHNPEDNALISFENNNCTIPFLNESMRLFQEPFKYAVQWALAVAPGHKILEAVIANIINSYPYFKGRIFQNPQVGILAFTGPGLFTKSLRETLNLEMLPKISLHSSDFSGNGVFSLPGSHLRFDKAKHYSSYKDTAIVL